jgi:hypothetical protein
MHQDNHPDGDDHTRTGDNYPSQAIKPERVKEAGKQPPSGNPNTRSLGIPNPPARA